MAKRELSSTLKNLKFMQRGALRQDKSEKEVEEVIPDGNFPSAGALKKCTVILEGDPRPGSMKGRMSFQSFNPSIDKLNEEGTSPCQPEASTPSSGYPNGRASDRENGSTNYESENMKLNSIKNDENGELKRKQPGVDSPNESQKNVQGGEEASPGDSRSSYRKPKREKLDWNVLRPPKGRKERE